MSDLFLNWGRLLLEMLGPVLSPMATSFLSVLVGALPFMVIAAFASAVLEVYVSKDAIARLVPKTGIGGVLLAPLLGLIVPMCECGIVPVARRMIQKGVPAPAAVTFMLANPILNPLTIYSTYLAFPYARQMVWLRLLLGYIAAVLIGLWISFRPGMQILRDAQHHGAACECGHDHRHDHQTPLQRFQACLDHAGAEFFDVTKYFIIGAGLAALAQALIDRSLLEALGRGPVTSVLVMIAFAFVICICSEADAFVAATFASTFTPGALLAFLVAGPMTDMKNTLMMTSSFRRSFVWSLNAAIFLITGLLAIGINYWPALGGG